MLSSRLDDPAGNLSGGQQQMLTLGMAFIEKPRLLMIDELSLGLAPSVVGQLLEIVRALRDDGTTIILVEQSVNVALTVAETAYFMEKGEIRFHGPTSELLERPDVLRSVFLEGAATHTAAVAPTPVAPAVGGNGIGAPAPNGVVATPRPTGPAANGGSRPDTEPRLVVRGVSKRFGGINALSDVGFTVAPGEILGFIGPNGAGKTTLFDAISGFIPADTGSISLLVDGTLHDVTRSSPQARARMGLGRSFQDGRLFPALTVSETIAVALDTQVDVRDPIAAALHLPAVIDSEAKVSQRVEELIELMGLGAFHDKFTRELSTGSRRIVDLACVLAHQPTVLLLDEPSSGIAQREAEALGPGAHADPRRPRRQRARDRARPPAAHVDRRPDGRARPRAGHRRRTVRRGRPRPAGRGVVPRRQPGRDRPIGPGGPHHLKSATTAPRTTRLATSTASLDQGGT